MYMHSSGTQDIVQGNRITFSIAPSIQLAKLVTRTTGRIHAMYWWCCTARRQVVIGYPMRSIYALLEMGVFGVVFILLLFIMTFWFLLFPHIFLTYLKNDLNPNRQPNY